MSSAVAASCFFVLLFPAALARAPAAANRGGTLRVVVSADFGSIEPALVTSYDGLQVMSATQLTLVARGTGTGARRFLPYGAVRLPSISSDGRTYVFRIRRGLRFSDGSPVSAQNFVAGFERLLDPRMHSQRAFLFDDISGARAFMSGSAAHVAGVVARANRLVVHLTRSTPDILDRLALPFVTAMPLNLPIVAGGVDAPLPSAGPYYAEKYEPGRLARLVRNPYWNPAIRPSFAANVDEIEYLGRAPDEAVAGVSRGDADVATAVPESLPADLVRELVHRYGINRGRFFVRQRLGRSSVVFNVTRPLFRNNAKLRRAVNFALDRSQLVAADGPLTGVPTDQLLLPGRPGFRDWKLYPYKGDIARAKRLTRGVLHRKDASLYVTADFSGPAVAAVIRADLARLGLRVHVKTLPSTIFVAALSVPRAPWDLAVAGWNTSRDDPIAFINFALDGHHIGRPFPGFNLGRFNERKWNERMRRVARMRRGRDAAYARLDRDLMRTSAPLAPYLVSNALTIFSARVGCVSWHFDGWPNLAGLCIK